MAHNRLPYRPALLGARFVPTPQMLRKLFTVAAESINGDEGGLWAPETPIIIGGSGVTISDKGGFTGGLATGRTAPPGALVLGDNDWPTFSANRTRSVVFPLADTRFAYLDTTQSTDPSEFDHSVPGSVVAGTGPTFQAVWPLDVRKFPVGATIASVVLRWRVRDKPTAVPGSLPTLSFISIPAALTDTQALPAPGTVAAYYNDGLPQSLTLTPVNNATVGTGQTYFAVISDGSNNVNIYHSIVVSFTGIANMRPGY